MVPVIDVLPADDPALAMIDPWVAGLPAGPATGAGLSASCLSRTFSWSSSFETAWTAVCARLNSVPSFLTICMIPMIARTCMMIK